MNPKDLVPMGRSAGAFGTKGEVKVYSFARQAEVFLRAERLWVGADPQAARPYRLVSLRPHAGRLLFSLEEVRTREEAQRLKGAWVFLLRTDLPPLEPDEYYWFQLKGVRVVTTGGRELGRIQQVNDYGASELWFTRDEQGREAIIPILEGVVHGMDLDAGLVVVEPPEGLLEAQGWPPQDDPPATP